MTVPTVPHPYDSPSPPERSGTGRTVVSRFVALGDSITAGLGDGVSMGRDRRRNGGSVLDGRGWAALLAGCFDPASAVEFHNLATTGATAGDVRRHQLPVALRLQPELVSVIAGMNDLLKPGYDPLALRHDLVWTVGRLRAAGATVLTAKLHDPGRLLWLAGPLRRLLTERVGRLNAAVAAAAGDDPGVIVVDLASHEEAYLPTTFDVDRVHPGPRGHRLLARAFAERLVAAGVPAVHLPDVDEPTRVPSRLDHAVWLTAVGIPWLVGRCRAPADRRPAASETHPARWTATESGTGPVLDGSAPRPWLRPGATLPTVGECVPVRFPFPAPRS